MGNDFNGNAVSRRRVNDIMNSWTCQFGEVAMKDERVECSMKKLVESATIFGQSGFIKVKLRAENPILDTFKEIFSWEPS